MIFQNGLYDLLINSNKIPANGWESTALLIGFIFISALLSYILGSVNSAIIVSGLLYKEDIRTHGSGNAGLTNMLRTYGKGAAALTLVGDMLKTAIAIFLTAALLGISYNGGISFCGYCYMAGLFAVLGHVYPIFYNFKGGKGVLVTATMALILTPVPFAILLTLFIIIVAISGFVSLGSCCVASLFPVAVYLYSRFLVEGQNLPILGLVCTIILAVFIVWCHRANIKRIANGTERKISIGGKKNK